MNISGVSGHPAGPVQQKPTEEVPANNGDAAQGQVADAAKSPPPAKDSVHVSTAAQKMQQEATETAAQTAMEAAKGDGQAKRLLAKEDAAKAESDRKPAPEPQEAKGSNVDVTA